MLEDLEGRAALAHPDVQDRGGEGGAGGRVDIRCLDGELQGLPQPGSRGRDVALFAVEQPQGSAAQRARRCLRRGRDQLAGPGEVLGRDVVDECFQDQPVALGGVAAESARPHAVPGGHGVVSGPTSPCCSLEQVGNELGIGSIRGLGAVVQPAVPAGPERSPRVQLPSIGQGDGVEERALQQRVRARHPPLAVDEDQPTGLRGLDRRGRIGQIGDRAELGDIGGLTEHRRGLREASGASPTASRRRRVTSASDAASAADPSCSGSDAPRMAAATSSGTPPVCRVSAAAVSADTDHCRVWSAKSRTAATSSGPGRTTVASTVPIGRTPNADPAARGVGRWAMTTRTRSARRRRRTNCSDWADSGSIHCASSTTSTTTSCPAASCAALTQAMSRRPTSTPEYVGGTSSPRTRPARPNGMSCSGSAPANRRVVTPSPHPARKTSIRVDLPIPASASITTSAERPDEACSRAAIPGQFVLAIDDGLGGGPAAGGLVTAAHYRREIRRFAHHSPLSAHPVCPKVTLCWSCITCSG